jgi:methionine-rich copper-binding protein CopC
LAAILLAAPLWAIPAASRGHTEVISVTPEDGAHLDQPPATVSVVFDQALTVTSYIRVADSAGAVVGEGGRDETVPAHNVVSLTLGQLPDGAYEVAWLVVGEDAHQVAGSASFVVGALPESAADDAGPLLPIILGLIVAAVAGLLLAVRVRRQSPSARHGSRASAARRRR